MQQVFRADDVDLVGLDARAAHLEGATISCKVLRGASFEGARLRGARFVHCDLSGAVLDGADLEGVIFLGVTAASARLRGANWRDGHADHCDLGRADLRHADLRRCHLRLTSLDEASLEFADLRHAKLTQGTCRAATFTAARMFGMIANGTDFTDASFDRAENFFMTREVLAEIFRPHARGDVEKEKIVALVQTQRTWCYPEWKRALDDHPALRDLALDIMSYYPESGFARAYRVGATPESAEPLDRKDAADGPPGS